MKRADVSDCIGAWIDGLRPAPELTLNDWASRYRVMSGKASAAPGRWRPDTAPFLEEPMAACSVYAPWELVALMGPSQFGKTEVALNLVGYHIHYQPAPILVVEPSLDMVKKFSRQRLDPMLMATDVLRGLVSEVKSREAANTIAIKDFPGGILILGTAGSAAALSSMPIRIVVLDEFAKYKPTDEGSVLGLVKARQRRFPRRKTFVPSTPLLAHDCSITGLIDTCDVERVWQVACPRCGEYQALEYDRLRHPDPGRHVPERVRGVRYECAHCAALWDADREQVTILRAGRWHTVRDNGDQISIGYRLPGLSVPWTPWSVIVAEYLKARGKPKDEQTVANTLLGVAYAESNDAPEPDALYARRESYAIGVVPPGVRFLTAFCDVNDGWLAVEVVGWGRNGESWSVLYRSIPGDVTDPGRGPWAELADLLAAEYPAAVADGSEGSIPIWCLGVDTGYNTTTVCNWARKFAQPVIGGKAIRVRRPRTVITTKGWPGWGPAIRLAAKADATEKKRGVKLVHLSTFTLKAELYRWLRRPLPAKGEPPPHGWCHFPEYDERYFQELTSEVFRQQRGKWRFDDTSGVRNEPLDCRVGARAAALACGVDQFSEHDWARIESKLPPALLPVSAITLAEPGGVVPDVVPAVPAVPGAGMPGRKRKRGGIVARLPGW